MNNVIPLAPRQRPEHELGARIALALSILNHRRWCADCRPHVRHAVMALRGYSIDQINAGDAN